jgi:hypothetical protein
MSDVHVECKPDETLVRKLGVSRKSVTHHQGKSRVFASLKKNKEKLAMVDEDPMSPKTTYERSLKLTEQFGGLKYYQDGSGNRVIVLSGKLEDWIISICSKQKLDLNIFGLPKRPNDLHDIINQKLPKFQELLDELIKLKNPELLKLQEWLN